MIPAAPARGIGRARVDGSDRDVLVQVGEAGRPVRLVLAPTGRLRPRGRGRVVVARPQPQSGAEPAFLGADLAPLRAHRTRVRPEIHRGCADAGMLGRPLRIDRGEWTREVRIRHDDVDRMGRLAEQRSRQDRIVRAGGHDHSPPPFLDLRLRTARTVSMISSTATSVPLRLLQRTALATSSRCPSAKGETGAVPTRSAR